MGTSVHERGSENVANYRPETLLRRQWITSLSNCSAVKLGISSKLSLTIRCQHIESVTVVKQLWYDWFRTGNIRGIHAGEIEAILSTDMSKAFDSVHPTLLLAKQKAYGFSESALNLMKSYFDGREKGSRVGTATSSRKEIRRGCPKGSNLSLSIILLSLSIILSLKVLQEYQVPAVHEVAVAE